MLFDREEADMAFEDSVYNVHVAIALFDKNELSFSQFCNELSSVANVSTLDLCTKYATGEIDRETLVKKMISSYIPYGTNNSNDKNTFESVDDILPTTYRRSHSATIPSSARLDAINRSNAEMDNYSPEEKEEASIALKKMQIAYPNSRNWFRTFRKNEVVLTVYQPYKGDKLSSAVDEFENYIKSKGGRKQILGTGNISYHLPKLTIIPA